MLTKDVINAMIKMNIAYNVNGGVSVENQVEIWIPYGTGRIPVHVAEENLAAVVEAPISAAAEGDQEELVRRAMEAPIGSRRLSELAQGKRKVLIVTSDHTRSVPSRITLPILTQEILAGQADAEITVLIATGLHRAMTQAELIDKFSREMVERFPFVSHNAFDSAAMEFVCVLPSGARFEVNRLALEADLVVTEGFIEPHFFAGFSGGRKSILPGISSRTSVVENHSFRALDHENARSGVLKGNPINEDMVAAARSVGVAFTLNVALNADKKIIGAFAGDLEEAHEAGCRFVRELSGAKRVKGDIVVTSNGGYPLDQNLYQCPKSISTAAEYAEEGGVLILAASCMDGIGGTYFEKLMTMGKPEQILEYLRGLPPRETIPEQWCAQVFARIMLCHPVILVSEHLPPGAAERVNMRQADDLDQALEMAYQLTGRQAKVVVIPDGVSVIAT